MLDQFAVPASVQGAPPIGVWRRRTCWGACFPFPAARPADAGQASLPARSPLSPAQDEQSQDAEQNWFDSDGVTMTPEDFAAKIEELRAIIADKIADLEENPAWGSGDDRQEVVQALDELVVQAQALSEALQQDVEEGEDSGEEA